MYRFLRLALYPPLLLAGACGEITGPRTHEFGWQAVELDSRVVHAYTAFGFDLFDQLVTAAPESNLFISPTSAAFALAMTYNGAGGGTRAGMAEALGIAGLAVEDVNRANREWLGSLRETGDPKVDLALANSIWAREGFPFHQAFYERNRQYYDAEVRELPFDAAALKAINDWVDRNTRGKIDRIIDDIPGDAVMYLINALYFKGQWRYRFDEVQTAAAPFTRPDGSRVQVPMMRQNVTVPYLRGDGFQAVSLPYGEGRFSMVLAVPDHGQDLDGFYTRLTPDAWAGWIAQMRETSVNVELPRFRVEWEKVLNEPLRAMGMVDAFDPAHADFSEMSPAPLFVSMVKQKTFVEVNEEGTEAAAVTVVEMRVTSGGDPYVRFDRPFFFAIQDNATGTLLFLGHIVDPSLAS
jgi:serine protease inhibitor